MLFIIWIIVGGVIGWLASLVMKTDAQQGLLLNIIVGIVGAFLGGWLLAPLFGSGTINTDDFNAPSLIISFLGAVILLAIFNLLRRGKIRCAQQATGAGPQRPGPRRHLPRRLPPFARPPPVVFPKQNSN